MKKTLLKGLALAAVGTLLTVGSSYAALLNGAVSLSGGWIGTGGVVGDLSDITGIDFTGGLAISGVGDFSVLTFGMNATMQDFVFKPLQVGGVVALWSVTAGPTTFQFDLTSLTINEQVANSIKLTGTGVFHATGFDDTPGNWVFTGNDIGGALSWSSSNGAVPEPATMLLFGVGLAGLAGVSRRKTE